MRPVSAWGGHWWTLAPHLRDSLPWRARPLRGQTLHIPVGDASSGTARLEAVHHSAGGDTLVVIIHGLGGSADSVYMHRAARACVAMDLPCLRLSLRGANLDGRDFHHAGLWQDLAAVLEAPPAAGAARRVLLGYSLGGHLALSLAVHRPDLADACAAICSPLDLDAGCRALDSLWPALYRRHVLRGLKEIYCVPGATHPMPSRQADVARVRTVREYDAHTVVPRFGFKDVDDYYAQASVGPRLSTLTVPSLYVQAVHDPMVPPHTTEPWLSRAPDALTVVRTTRGGHVGFPDTFRLPSHATAGVVAAPPGLEAQTVAWLASRALGPKDATMDATPTP